MRTPRRPRRLRRFLPLIAVAVAVACGALLAGCASDGTLSPEQGSAEQGSAEQGSAEQDGVVPEGTTVFDDHLPAVAGLSPELRSALRDASAAAADDGLTLVINSGWRSPHLQSRLLREAVSTYGSKEEAARWVATPETSPHVSGDAVDIGPWAGAEWLGRHGAAFGLCQIYINEAWHFEYRAESATRGCPRMFLDPTQDPRMAG